MSAEDENLKVFYRRLSTDELLTLRAQLHEQHRTVLPYAKQALVFRAHRRRLVTEVLQERGVKALN